MLDMLLWLIRLLSFSTVIALVIAGLIDLFKKHSDRAAAKRIAATACPWCSLSLATITHKDLENHRVKYALCAGTKVLRDRLPQLRAICPNCHREICFDQNFRVTACDGSDAFRKTPASQN